MKPSEYHACATGDCPHETQAECTAALLALADEQAAEIDRLQTALDDVQAARRRADDVVADQHIEIERLKATHSRLNEADVMVWVLRDFGYCTGLRGVWIPHHCFGDTEITVTGLEWEITSKPYHKAGFGFHALMVAMAECRVQPFKWSDEAAQAEDSPEDQDAIGARIDALVAGGELDGDELPEVAYGKEGVMSGYIEADGTISSAPLTLAQQRELRQENERLNENRKLQERIKRLRIDNVAYADGVLASVEAENKKLRDANRAMQAKLDRVHESLTTTRVNCPECGTVCVVPREGEPLEAAKAAEGSEG